MRGTQWLFVVAVAGLLIAALWTVGGRDSTRTPLPGCASSVCGP